MQADKEARPTAQSKADHMMEQLHVLLRRQLEPPSVLDASCMGTASSSCSLSFPSPSSQQYSPQTPSRSPSRRVQRAPQWQNTSEDFRASARTPHFVAPLPSSPSSRSQSASPGFGLHIREPHYIGDTSLRRLTFHHEEASAKELNDIAAALSMARGSDSPPPAPHLLELMGSRTPLNASRRGTQTKLGKLSKSSSKLDSRTVSFASDVGSANVSPAVATGTPDTDSDLTVSLRDTVRDTVNEPSIVSHSTFEPHMLPSPSQQSLKRKDTQPTLCSTGKGKQLWQKPTLAAKRRWIFHLPRESIGRKFQDPPPLDQLKRAADRAMEEGVSSSVRC
jgi:hypothetical protein